MIVELAIATRTAPAQWWTEPDEVIATAIVILAEQAEAMKSARRKR